MHRHRRTNPSFSWDQKQINTNINNENNEYLIVYNHISQILNKLKGCVHLLPTTKRKSILHRAELRELILYKCNQKLGVGKKTEPNRVKPNQPNRNRFTPNQNLFQTIWLKIFPTRLVRFKPNRTEKPMCFVVI